MFSLSHFGSPQSELVKINVVSAGEVINCVTKSFNIINHTEITFAEIVSFFGVGINGISSNTKKCEEKLLKHKNENAPRFLKRKCCAFNLI